MAKKTHELKINKPASKLEIISDDGKKGGHVRGKGHVVNWVAGSNVDSFDLDFQRFDDADGVVEPAGDWPFVFYDVQPKPGAQVDPFAGTVRNATSFKGRLTSEPGVYSYSVATPTAVLDPIIIIEK